MSQVHSKDTTDLLEGKYFLLFVPSGALHLPIILLELGTGVKAGGRAGGAGHAIVTRVPADKNMEEESSARHQPKTTAVTCNNHRCSMLKIFCQSSEIGIQYRSKESITDSPHKRLNYFYLNSFPTIPKTDPIFGLFLTCTLNWGEPTSCLKTLTFEKAKLRSPMWEQPRLLRGVAHPPLLWHSTRIGLGSWYGRHLPALQPMPQSPKLQDPFKPLCLWDWWPLGMENLGPLKKHDCRSTGAWQAASAAPTALSD